MAQASSFRNKEEAVLNYKRLPQVCTYYGSPGCSRPNCSFLHICKYFTRMAGCDRSQHGCNKTHDLYNDHNKTVLERCGIDTTSETAGAVLYKLRRLWLEKHIDQEKKTKNSSETQEQDKTYEKCPPICIEHNDDGCLMEGCPCLHICKLYLMKCCNEPYKKCEKLHDIISPHNKKVLETCGFQLRQKTKFVLEAVREAKGFSQRQDTTAQVPSYPPAAKPRGQDHRKGDKKEFPTKGPRKNTSQAAQPQEQDHRKGDNRESPSKGARKKTSQAAQPQDEHKVTICIYNLLGDCCYRDNCPHYHNSLPYQWQYKIPTVGWWNFKGDMGRMTETAYTDVKEDSCSAMIGNSRSFMKVDFKTMKATGEEGQIMVRRLSTVSAAVAPPGSQLTTHWCWYWKDDIGSWEPYTDITAVALEVSYDPQNPEGYFEFVYGQQKYIISFKDMKQQNVSTKKVRLIRRRPQQLMTVDDVQKAKRATKATKIQSMGTQGQALPSYPEEWELMGDEPYKLVPLKPSHKSYKKIKIAFDLALSGKSIHGIKRVQNLELWHNLMGKKERMEKANGQDGINEMLLYHGTTAEVVPAICKQNFHWRLSATREGVRYGRGSYFHKDPAYFDDYSAADQCGIQRMFVARILVGKSCNGKMEYWRPPPLDPSNPLLLYDSMVDSTSNPSIFVISFDSQYYPEFIVEYSS